MQKILDTLLAHPLLSAGGFCVAGAGCGALDLEMPTTVFFLLAGLVLMTASGRTGAARGK